MSLQNDTIIPTAENESHPHIKHIMSPKMDFHFIIKNKFQQEITTHQAQSITSTFINFLHPTQYLEKKNNPNNY
jgi:hypothetical protein